MIERDKIRYLADRHHKVKENHHRVRVDISHFDISHIYRENSVRLDTSDPNEEAKEGEDRLLKKDIKLVGIAKHLCGGATDLAIHSLTQSPLTYGVVIATCCHQKCDLRTYVNIPFLDQLGFKKDYEKSWLFKTTSWAVSGAYRVDQAKNDESISKSSLLKTVTGYKAKRIIDLGRAIILAEKCGLKVNFRQY